MLNLEKLPYLRHVRLWVEANHPQVEDVDAYIAAMTPDAYVKAYLEWNGILGYEWAICNVVRSADAARQ